VLLSADALTSRTPARHHHHHHHMAVSFESGPRWTFGPDNIFRQFSWHARTDFHWALQSESAAIPRFLGRLDGDMGCPNSAFQS
jgi:hypothetical protein